MAETMLRRVIWEDAVILFDWANDPLVRLNSINTDPIKWNDHLTWLQNKLNSETVFLILEVNHKPAGQIRFDYDNIEKNWVIDYSISFSFRGNGFGKKIVEEGLKWLNKFPVVALVKTANVISVRIFESLGFRNVGRETVGDVELIKLIRIDSSK